MILNSDSAQEILNQLPSSVVVTDENNTLIHYNQQLLHLIGGGQPMKQSRLRELQLLEPETNRPIFSPAHWLSWPEGKIRQLRAYIQLRELRKPVFVSARRGASASGANRLYISLFDLSKFETFNAPKGRSANQPNQYFGLVGKTPQMQDLFNLIEMASGSSVNVVIHGESGTGKELVAAAVHRASDRSDKPFIRINCAAISETLLESELFGHVKGAFTGAYKDRIGTFEAAHQGTILLDEIGEISPAVQVKLLRVLQERIIVRVGDNREIPVDVRVIAATNKNLRRMVSKGKFREDLFYRLNVFPIHIPSLSARKSDIVLLCHHFLQKHNTQTGKKILTISPDTMRLFLSYCWPGNVRELENSIEHAFVLCRTSEIQMEDLPHDLREAAIREGICAERSGIPNNVTPATAIFSPKRPGNRLNISKESLLSELERHGGNKAATARSLGISSVGLWKKMKKFGI